MAIQHTGKIGNVLKVVAFYFSVSNNLESNYCSTLHIHKFNDFIWCIVNLHKNMKLLILIIFI